MGIKLLVLGGLENMRNLNMFLEYCKLMEGLDLQCKVEARETCTKELARRMWGGVCVCGS